MPTKRKQKSRLNSLIEIRSSTDIVPNSVKKTSNLSIKEEKSIGDGEDWLNEAECCEEMIYEESESELKIGLSRTSMLIQDYKEFKAARCIQRYVRGWLYRTKYRRQRLAAIVIQKEWRRFHCQRLYFQKVEETLQQSIEQHYYRAAQKIQSLWRGWYVRHYIHDHTRMMRLQLMAGEDLLYCVAFKLHHLLRTHQIPGVYSLRNSSALSKVEQLLSSLTFKACNQRSVQAKEQRRHEIEAARREHKKSAYGTKVPFSGPNIHNLCAPKCMPLYNAKDADMRMSKILQIYEAANRDLEKPKKLRKKSVESNFLALSKHSQVPESLPKSSSFCGDVVNSMKKWKIITDNNLNVDSNVFKNPQNVENFLKEIESIMSLLQGNCYCRREFQEDLNKEMAKFIKQQEDKTKELSCETFPNNRSQSVGRVNSSLASTSAAGFGSTNKVASNLNRLENDNSTRSSKYSDLLKRVTITDIG